MTANKKSLGGEGRGGLRKVLTQRPQRSMPWPLPGTMKRWQCQCTQVWIKPLVHLMDQTDEGTQLGKVSD